MSRRGRQRGPGQVATAVVCAVVAVGVQRAVAATFVTYSVDGDRIAAPLDGLAGNAVRGRRIVLDREIGNCLICHQVPEPTERFQGDLGPDLAGVGLRLDAGQLRLRLVDQSRLNPATIMPPYHRTERLTRVMEKYRGRPVLAAQEIEDVVAYLATLRN